MALEAVAGTSESSILGIAHRDGLGGRCRRIRVQYLWVQESVRERALGLEKVDGKVNPADMMTKAVPSEVLQQHLMYMNFENFGGRAAKSSKLLNSLTLKIRRSRAWGGVRIHLPPDQINKSRDVLFQKEVQRREIKHVHQSALQVRPHT